MRARLLDAAHPTLGRTHWIFDMDGTLTRHVHDFAWMRATLGLPADQPILESIRALPEAERPAVHARLDAIEWDYAEQASPADGVFPLLDALKARDVRVAILTRNQRDIAQRTLEVAGLWSYFAAAPLFGRDEALPKPHPDGIRRILSGWGASPDDAVMVGDSSHDLDAAVNAGVPALIVHPSPPAPWGVQADLIVPTLATLHTLVGAA